MKKAVKFTLTITSIVSLCFSCLFSKTVYAATTRYNVNVNYVKEKYYAIAEYDKESQIVSVDGMVNFQDIDAYIDQGTDGATDNVDHDFPAFVVADTSYHSNSNAIPMTRRCIEFSELTSIYMNANGATGNSYINDLVDWLCEVNPLSQYNSATMAIRYEVLYKLGYRITGYCQTTTTSGNTVYLYTLQKLQGSDHINFYGGADLDLSVFHYSTGNNYVLYEYIKYTFDVTNMLISGQSAGNSNNYLQFIENSDYVYPVSLELDSVLNDSSLNSNQYGRDWTIYSIQDMIVSEYGSYSNLNDQDDPSYKTYTFKIVGRQPSVTLVRFYQVESYIVDINALLTPTRTTSALNYISLYRGAGSDLTSINQHLVTIEDLLSDLQVQEINNIYNDITYEYDVDIDLTIDDLLGDLGTNIQEFNFQDPNIQIPTNDLEKISGFKLIFTNLVNTMNSTGIGVLYFLPLVLLIIGALL